MRKWASGSGLVLLCLCLGGCAHSPQSTARARVPDWEAEPSPAAPARADSSGGRAGTAVSSDAAQMPGETTHVAPTDENTATASAGLTTAQATENKNRLVPLQAWCREARLPDPLRLSGNAAPAFEVRGTNGLLFVHTGSRLAAWEGVEVRLGFPPTLIDNQPFVHAVDIKKTFEPLLFSSCIRLSAAKPVIVIDPGHGGENAGTRSSVGTLYEKNFTLDWAKRLAQLLETEGWAVFLTRQGDNNLALSNRVSFADAHKAGLFISLHFNSAGPAESESGLETYCLTPVGMPSTVTRGFADEMDTRFPNNVWDTQNLQLAYAIHRALLHGTGMHDRGIRRARFPGVLRNQNRPAILVEGGYLSNPDEARRIAEPEFRQKLAEAVAAGLGVIWKAGSAGPSPNNE